MTILSRPCNASGSLSPIAAAIYVRVGFRPNGTGSSPTVRPQPDVTRTKSPLWPKIRALRTRSRVENSATVGNLSPKRSARASEPASRSGLESFVTQPGALSRTVPEWLTSSPHLCCGCQRNRLLCSPQRPDRRHLSANCGRMRLIFARGRGITLSP